MIALDVENSVPACAIILERDLRAQLHQLFFGKLIAQTRIQIVRDIRRRISHRVSQLNDKTFRVIEWRSLVAEHSAQFVIAQACFSAHGRIDIYSEWAADPRRGADFSQLNVTQRDKSFAAKPRFHGDAAPDETGQTHLDLRRRKIFTEHFAHHAVKPPQMPRCVLLRSKPETRTPWLIYDASRMKSACDQRRVGIHALWMHVVTRKRS